MIFIWILNPPENYNPKKYNRCYLSIHLLLVNSKLKLGKNSTGISRSLGYSSPSPAKWILARATATATVHYAELNCSCTQLASDWWLDAVCLQIAHFSTSQVNYQQAVMVQNWVICSLMFFLLLPLSFAVWSLLCFLYFALLKKGYSSLKFKYLHTKLW